ncbi:MAG: hypothetical protein A2261_01050 [Candidatus Magasanikbacteria bacterium RIFOXYA2_FULL_44_8]|uniref:YgjP-like metallopeptidase domain-containing protein n=1 Tax=Candidatus Magasanikbacteria bacterium RIFOXYA2_FULL_44_8 TaxID=1798696 RepID=A0A1F6NKJ6_9BACT|nr:MAG: hypothetical protein A2261_01050 [Candidatus Magasanikbacteria bacterium RIFOXYA2_FULL_44_8]
MYYFFRARRRRPRRRHTAGDRRKYLQYREQARALVYALVAQVNQHYHFPIGRITIRNNRSRWGSCSKKHNLNFNYKLVFLPEHLAEYIVVHELCHIGQFNHSQKFWDLVGEYASDYVGRIRELKKVH